MNDNYQTNMYLFTKYINKTLKDEPLVTGWAFEINYRGTYELIVSIDYIDRLHSKERRNSMERTHEQELAFVMISAVIEHSNMSYEDKLVELAYLMGEDDDYIIEHINLAIGVLEKAKEEILNR